MRKLAVGVFLLVSATAAHASADCAALPTSMAKPIRPTVLSPISTDLATPAYQLGAQGSVLSQAFDESQSVDQVLLRLRIESCQNIAKATAAPTAIDPNDPAAYKPKTAFDNTPWRFDMSQNGKRMTAEEFDAWMKARGVRVAKGAPPPAPAAEPVPAAAAVAGGAPAAPSAAPASPAAPTPAPAAAATPAPATGTTKP